MKVTKKNDDEYAMTLTKEEIVTINNSLLGVLEEFRSGAEFHARIGVERDEAEKMSATINSGI